MNNDKRKTADAPLSLFTQPTNPRNMWIDFFIYFVVGGGDEYNQHSLLGQMTVQQTFISSGERWERNTQTSAEIWEPFVGMTDEAT